MRRYYIADILGDGTEENPYRTAVSGIPDTNVAAEITTHPLGHPQQGHPVFTSCLAFVAAKDHAEIRALPGVDPLPDFPLDGKVSAINAATKGLMKAALTRRGLDADSIVDAKDGYREVIRGIGQHFNPQFSEDRFHVVDV